MTENINSWPVYDKEEMDAVNNVLSSGNVNYWTGDEGRKFEQEFASFCDVKYAVALANGTVALELALRALGIGVGDEVIVTSRTFIASVSAIIMVGAKPVFADVDLNSQNITPDTVVKKISPATRAIICVHLAGWPCDMDGMSVIAEKNKLFLIEDCAQAHGAAYKERPVGGIGHVAAWSFCQDKIMSTGGEGGMLTTNDHDIFKKVWSYKDHGKSWDAVYKANHPPGFRWLHETFGTNMRMTEMQAAIGRVQLRKMKNWHALRKKHAEHILNICERHSDVLRVPSRPENIEHAWYKFYVFLRLERLKEGWSRDRVMDEIKSYGVPCFSGSCSEVYFEKAFQCHESMPDKRLPNAKQLGETSLMFLIHPTLTELEIDKTCDAIVKVINSAKNISAISSS